MERDEFRKEETRKGKKERSKRRKEMS